MKAPLADARTRLLANRNYRWYLSGAAVSMLGDQFTMLAFPWLVLELTGDPFMLGAALAAIGVPRVCLMVFGGAVVDRCTPARVLLYTRRVNSVLVGLLAVLLIGGWMKLWMVFAVAVGLGVSTAFSLPGLSSMLPSLVRPEQLAAANSALSTARQMSMFVGPVLAGVTVAFFPASSNGEMREAHGLASAFLIDAASYVFAWFTLTRLRLPPRPAIAPGTHTSPLKSTVDGLRFCRDDVLLRTCFIYWSCTMFFVVGPIQVILPLMASARGNAADLGLLVGAYGGGALGGSLIAGAWPNMRIGTLGVTLLAMDLATAVLLPIVGMAGSAWPGLMALFSIGLLAGYGQLISTSWIQRRVPLPMLGRVMGVFMMIVTGVTPLSGVVAGRLLAAVPPSTACWGAAICLLVTACIGFFFTPFPRMVDAQDPAATASAAGRKRKYAADQIMGFLREAQAGASIDDLCAKHGFTRARFEAWHSKFRELQRRQRSNDSAR